MASHKITRKEAKKIVDKWLTLRLDQWKDHFVDQLAGQTITEYTDTLTISVEMEIDTLAVWFAINAKPKGKKGGISGAKT